MPGPSYGLASIELDKMLWPAGHPYSWPTIGYMEDLTAASHDDVVNFFKTYYTPGNATLVIAGDIDFDRTIRANLRHYDPARRTVIAERLVGRGRRRTSLADVVRFNSRS